MRSSCLEELEPVVYQLVSTHPTVRQATGGRVFDGESAVEVPFPYVVIGEWTETGEDIHTSLHRGVTCVIHIWSTYEGSREARMLANAVSDALVGKSFPMANWHVSRCHLDNVQLFNDVNGSRHGAIRYRFAVQSK